MRPPGTARLGARLAVIGLICGVTLVLGWILLGGPTMAVEEPAFRTLVHEGIFEIRDYPALVVAEVTVGGDRDEAVRKGFRILAGYIFGGNKPRQNQAGGSDGRAAAGGEKIAMTAPVGQSRRGDAWVIRFGMPSGYSLDKLPEPDDPAIALTVAPAARYAVVRFSGLAGPDDVAAKTKMLGAWITRRNLHQTGPTTLARYDPPWTLWFVRRNEVMIPVERDSAESPRN